MALRDQPLRTTEFLVVDVETTGHGGADCELTEVGAVLVGGGELHDRYESLVAARRAPVRAVERLTGISRAMLATAQAPERVLEEVSERLRGRVMVAHSAAFDRRALANAFAATGLRWPDPPVLCTVALARRFAPLVGQRGLAPLARALDIEVATVHRALADAETCAWIFCALFGRLCAAAPTVGDALDLFARRRRRARRRRPPGTLAPAARPAAEIDFASLPTGPGVYVFRDGAGRALYVGKSVRVRARARAHFAPGAEPAGWTAHAALVDHRSTASELGALVLENRLIKRMRPPGNRNLKHGDRWVYIRCRLDIPFPMLEVAREPAAGLAVSVGPLRGRAGAVDLVEQLNSLFSLRRCGRRLPRRSHPSAYGQMGHCLSPCLGDLDPNLYRRRLDGALAVFAARGGARQALLAHVEAEMRRAATDQRYERAAVLSRRHSRLRTLLERLEGGLSTLHARSRLVLAPGPEGQGCDAFWLVGGRVVAWNTAPAAQELRERTALALGSRPPRGAPVAVPADEVDEVRIVATWLAAHPGTPALDLEPVPGDEALAELLASASGDPALRTAARRPAR